MHWVPTRWLINICASDLPNLLKEMPTFLRCGSRPYLPALWDGQCSCVSGVTKRIIWLASAWQAVLRIWLGVIVYLCCYWRLRDQMGNSHLHTYADAKHSNSIWHLPYRRLFLIFPAIHIHRLGQSQTPLSLSIAVLLTMADDGQPGPWLLERPWHGQPYSGVDLGLKSML